MPPVRPTRLEHVPPQGQSPGRRRTGFPSAFLPVRPLAEASVPSLRHERSAPYLGNSCGGELGHVSVENRSFLVRVLRITQLVTKVPPSTNIRLAPLGSS